MVQAAGASIHCRQQALTISIGKKNESFIIPRPPALNLLPSRPPSCVLVYCCIEDWEYRTDAAQRGVHLVEVRPVADDKGFVAASIPLYHLVVKWAMFAVVQARRSQIAEGRTTTRAMMGRHHYGLVSRQRENGIPHRTPHCVLIVSLKMDEWRMGSRTTDRAMGEKRGANALGSCCSSCHRRCVERGAWHQA